MTDEIYWSDRAPLIIKLLQNTSARATAVIRLYRRYSIRNSAYIGVGRDDGKTAGEYNPIFYK